MKCKEVGTERFAVRGAILMTAVALALVALGCGEQKEQASAGASGGPSAAIEPVAETRVASVVSGHPEAEAPTENQVTASPDSLPPDVTATASDTLAVPGGIIEITAQGSSDVTAITLTDGIGHTHPFAYDSAAKAWRVFYRVPLKTREERLGLSATAVNGVNRWKRVWVFLNTQLEEPKEEVQSIPSK